MDGFLKRDVGKQRKELCQPPWKIACLLQPHGSLEWL